MIYSKTGKNNIESKISSICEFMTALKAAANFYFKKILKH